MSREYSYPVFATQGGGLVREVSGIFIFVEKSDCPGLDVGDEKPAEWDYFPANQLARTQLMREEDDRDKLDPLEQAPDRVHHLGF